MATTMESSTRSPSSIGRTATGESIKFKTPPPLVSMRRSRIFVTKLREISRAHVGEQQQKIQMTSAVPPLRKAKETKTRFRPIKTILDWAEGSEILTCSGVGPCKPAVASVLGRNSSKKIHRQNQQQNLSRSLHEQRNLRDFIFGADDAAASSGRSDSYYSNAIPSFTDDSAWTTDDDEFNPQSYLDSSLYTTDHWNTEDDLTLDDTTTVSSWADESRQYR